MVSVGLTLLGLAAIGWGCERLVPPIRHTAEFRARFTVLDGFLYPGQPAKTVGYQAGCVALPVLLGIGMYGARRWAKKLSELALDRLIWTGLVSYLLALAACAWPMIHCPHPPFPMVPPSWLLLPFDFSHPFCTPARILFLFAAAGILFCFLRVRASRQNANRALLILLVLWVVLIPSRFYAPSEINDELRFVYHLNSVLDALSQSVDGHHLLIDFPHIYGGYVEMLAPFIRLLPVDVGTLIVALAVPNVIGML